jgi:predicted component of type VI protein secretion system
VSALQQLQASIASSQQQSALQLLSSLALAIELHRAGRDMQDALAATQVQLQQQHQLAAELQHKLAVAEQQVAARAAQQAASDAAAAAAQGQLAAAREQLEAALLCQICFDKPRDTVLLPCMHFCYCSGCVAAAKAAAAKQQDDSSAAARPSARQRSSSSSSRGRGSNNGTEAGGGSSSAGGVLKCPVCRSSCSGQLTVHLSAL